MGWLLSIHWVLVTAVWYLANGLLHDTFVLINHKGKYDRNLLRLLMDGHILILSGAVILACYLIMLNKVNRIAMISAIVAVGMLVYCAMIFPFLKSLGTIAISIMLLIVSLRILIAADSSGVTVKG